MYLIVGLGNPGAQYAHTRHNVGFDVVALLAEKCNVSIQKKRANALVGECFIGGQKTLLVLPQTFMNLSGQTVAELMQYYHIPPENILIIYDDIDIAQGAIRIRKNGSAGTHNGMRSIVSELKGEENFPRLRVGVGKKRPEFTLADWVLSRYQSEEEQKIAKEAYDTATKAVVEYIEHGIESAMCLYNTKKQKAPKSPQADKGANLNE